MNESALLKLKVIVERAVRRVKASFSWKKKLREELLAHVTGVFEEELPRCADETAALTQVEKRFGEPGDLARTLQSSVPTAYRTAFQFEQWIGPRPGESLIQRAVRHGVTSLAVEAAYFVVFSPLFFVFWKPQEFGIFVSFALLISVGFGGMMFVSTLLINGLDRTLFSEAGRSFLSAVLLIVVSFLVPVLLYLGFISAVSLRLPDDFQTFDWASSWRILSATVVFTGIIIWLANRSFTEKQHLEEWSTLQID